MKHGALFTFIAHPATKNNYGWSQEINYCVKQLIYLCGIDSIGGKDSSFCPEKAQDA